MARTNLGRIEVSVSQAAAATFYEAAATVGGDSSEDDVGIRK